MPKKAALLTVHGMGRTEEDYNAQIVSDLRHRLEELSAETDGSIEMLELVEPVAGLTLFD